MTTYSPGHAAQTPDRQFEKLGLEFVEQAPALSPIYASWLGDHRYDGVMDDVSDESRSKSVAFLRAFEKRLAEIDPQTLSLENRIDYDMLKQHLQSRIFATEELREWAWNPTVYTGMTGDAVYHLVARDFAPLEQRLGHVAERLEQFPRFLKQVRETLQPDRVPPMHAETAVKQNRGVLSILDNLVIPHLDKLPKEKQNQLKKAIEIATGAIQEHQTWLENELLPKAKADFRIGKELFDQKLRFSLGTDMTREQIKKKAIFELARTRSKMYEIAKELYAQEHPWTVFPENPSQEYKQAVLRSAFDIVCQDLPERDRLVEVAKESLVKATEFIREKNLLTLPEDPLEIILMPEFRRGYSVAYCDSPGPLDIGQKTYYAISPIPEDWTAGQVRSFLREYNPFSIHELTIHEAMPGHYVQLAASQRYPGRLRALLSSETFIEGWAVYTELMMTEQGFCDGDPRMKLVMMKWYLRVLTNALIDQAIHVDGMNRDAAMRLMVETGLQEEREAALKWNRAQLNSTQLTTYFVGFQEVLEIRRACQEKQGNAFDLKSFHDRLISFGSPSPRFVREVMIGK